MAGVCSVKGHVLDVEFFQSDKSIESPVWAFISTGESLCR